MMICRDNFFLIFQIKKRCKNYFSILIFVVYTDKDYAKYRQEKHIWTHISYIIIFDYI